MDNLHQQLFDENHIEKEQYQLLDSLNRRKIISLYFELRLILYLGIMLFTAGIGYIIYQNMSDIGHLALMSLLALSIIVAGVYIHKKSKPYAPEVVEVEHFYFDYVLVLVALLIVSLFTYIQVYYDLVELLVRWTSLLSGLLFLFLAYRYDNKMVLSMGITALAAAIGLTLSPVDWSSGELLEGFNIYVISVGFGIMLLVSGYFLAHNGIKSHFKFTYHNFGFFLIYFGALALMFDSDNEELIAFSLLFFAMCVGYYCWRQKEFLFFLYSSISGYIAFTYLFISIGIDADLYFYYFPISAIGGVILLVKNRNHFSND
ncbi:MAG: DUF2157 domain-containing protein [Reichenbachiella sp.]|uniref:DUF2157 domain-containing protein n=1 Tax=Reichenbachiella sp. TaxID=2184521 RepID=UPI003265FE0B